MGKGGFMNVVAASIVLAAVVIGFSIYDAGRNQRYTLSSVGTSGLYILDGRSGEIEACRVPNTMWENRCVHYP